MNQMELFNQHKTQVLENPPLTIAQRKEYLKALALSLDKYTDKIVDAINSDFAGRSDFETKMLEVLPLKSEIALLIKNVGKWTKDRRVSTSINFLPGKNVLRTEPLGVVGIIAPWNYPLLLCLSPLAGAIAASNAVMLKVSEYVPHLNSIIYDIITEVFPKELVTVVQGNKDVAQAFSQLPFDHLLYTGSTKVGRSVMQEASHNLTPVTLELGGKSPVFIGRDYSIKEAARSIVKAKSLNAGQTCVAPDYVVLPDYHLAEFINEAIGSFNTLYPNYESNDEYTALINQAAYDRLKRYLYDEVETHSAQAIELGKENKKLPLTLVVNPPKNTLIRKDEIFGPLLIVETYKNIETTVSRVKVEEKPLALYIYSNNSRFTNYILDSIQSGGVTVNDAMLHVGQESLPFGGVGASGMGHYHGEYSIKTFSKLRGVFYQSKFNSFKFLSAPYTKLKKKIVDFIIKIS